MNIDILKKLLDAAVATVKPADPYDPKDLVSAFVKEGQRHANDETRMALISHLELEPELKKFGVDLVIPLPGMGKEHHGLHFRPDDLADWLVSRTLKMGSDRAIDDLNRYLHSKTIPYNLVTMFYGFKVEGSIKLRDDIILSPLSETPDSMEKRRFQTLNLVDAGIITEPHGSIVSKFDHPLEYISNEAYRERNLIEWRNNSIKFHHETVDALLCLSIAGRCHTEIIANWFIPDEWVPVPYKFGPGSSSPGSYRVRMRIAQKLEPDVYQHAGDLFAHFSNLDEIVRARLRIPLQRVNSAMGKDSNEDRMIDLGIAMEALYLNRALKFLRENNTQRGKDLYNLIGALYQMRNHAVHRGKIDAKYNFNKIKKNSRMLFDEGIEEICLTLKRIIVDGRPDWDSLIPEKDKKFFSLLE
jgi:hypothetical protein